MARLGRGLGRGRPGFRRTRGIPPAPDDIAQLLFTSGTTGEPKGVPQSSENLVRAVSMEIGHLGLGARDVVWVPSPLAHQTGFLYGMVLALVLGVPQILQGVWDAKRALRLLNQHEVTFVQAATPFVSDLVKAVEDGGEPRVICGSSLPPGPRCRAPWRSGQGRCWGPRSAGRSVRRKLAWPR
ncbi:AMP-binding protein [Streptomyces sp. S1D4-11]